MESGWIIFNTITNKPELNYGVFFNRTTPAMILKKLRYKESILPLKLIECKLIWEEQ